MKYGPVAVGLADEADGQRVPVAGRQRAARDRPSRTAPTSAARRSRPQGSALARSRAAASRGASQHGQHVLVLARWHRAGTRSGWSPPRRPSVCISAERRSASSLVPRLALPRPTVPRPPPAATAPSSTSSHAATGDRRGGDRPVTTAAVIVVVGMRLSGIVRAAAAHGYLLPRGCLVRPRVDCAAAPGKASTAVALLGIADLLPARVVAAFLQRVQVLHQAALQRGHALEVAAAGLVGRAHQQVGRGQEWMIQRAQVLVVALDGW